MSDLAEKQNCPRCLDQMFCLWPLIPKLGHQDYYLSWSNWSPNSLWKKREKREKKKPFSCYHWGKKCAFCNLLTLFTRQWGRHRKVICWWRLLGQADYIIRRDSLPSQMVESHDWWRLRWWFPIHSSGQRPQMLIKYIVALNRIQLAW